MGKALTELLSKNLSHSIHGNSKTQITPINVLISTVYLVQSIEMPESPTKSNTTKSTDERWWSETVWTDLARQLVDSRRATGRTTAPVHTTFLTSTRYYCSD